MIYYIGYYNCDQIQNESRICAPAAKNKMGYMISALAEAIGEQKMEVISCAETTSQKYVKGSRCDLSEGVSIKTFASFQGKNKASRGLGHLWTKLAVWKYLLSRVRSEDHVIVYHSLALMNLVKAIKALKRCKLTIEVEEIYGDVLEKAKVRKKELRYFTIADNYIFVNKQLNEKVNQEDKPFAIVHGSYKSIKDFGCDADDGKIHLVYAGTFRKNKGVEMALAVPEYLDGNYTVEILGHGNQSDIDYVIGKCTEMSAKSDCKVTYAGFKSGDEFDMHIQKCHIGLCTQRIDAKFNATSFPSKVLMYMSNGLRVVSVRIPAIETSAVGEYIYFYDHQDPREVADAIRSVTFDDGYNSRTHLDILHKDFVVQLKKILNG